MFSRVNDPDFRSKTDQSLALFDRTPSRLKPILSIDASMNDITYCLKYSQALNQIPNQTRSDALVTAT